MILMLKARSHIDSVDKIRVVAARFTDSSSFGLELRTTFIGPVEGEPEVEAVPMLFCQHLQLLPKQDVVLRLVRKQQPQLGGVCRIL